MRCTLNGQRFEVATGFMVHHDNWNESKQLIKGRTEDVKIINNRLYIEAWGRGTNKIINSCLDAGLPEPVITEEMGGVSITFLNFKERANKGLKGLLMG